jgi:hypothetical protein
MSNRRATETDAAGARNASTRSSPRQAPIESGAPRAIGPIQAGSAPPDHIERRGARGPGYIEAASPAPGLAIGNRGSP